MPKADPVLMHVINTATNEPIAVRWTEGGLAVTVRREASNQLAATGTAASAGDNTMVAAPGSGNQIAVTALVLQNESDTATTMIAKWGSTEAIRVLGQNQGDGIALTFPAGRELVGGDDQPLLLNLDGANSCGYSVIYYVVVVE